MKYLIYTLTSKTTGKLYVGKTTRGLNIRMNEHKHKALGEYNNKSKLYNAIRKYGFDDFTVQIVYQSNCVDDLDRAEQQIIQTYDTINRGYNIQRGGDGGDTSKHIDYQSRRSYKGKNNPNYGNKKLAGKNNPNARIWFIIKPSGKHTMTKDLTGFCRQYNLIPNSFRNSYYRKIRYKGYRLDVVS